MSTDAARTTPQQAGYIPALDGVRTIAVLLVMYFHFWQQNWLQPFLLRLGFVEIDTYPFASAGFLGVELLFVISGFLLYLPVAHQDRLDIRAFYRKRVIRIVPSYWLCVLVCACFAWEKFATPGAWAGYTLQNMAFLNMFRRELIFNEINSVLWSMSVEVWFYILFPLVAWLFRRKPGVTTLLCFAVAWVYRSWVLQAHGHELVLYMNQLPGMLDCFVGGMFAAHVAARLRQANNTGMNWGAVSVLGLLGLWFFLWLLNYQRGSSQGVQYYQIVCRPVIVMVCMLAVGGAALAGPVYQKVLGGRGFRFLSMISYNLYLWHQWLAVKLKAWRIPNWQGVVATDDKVWQWQHMGLSIAVAVGVAVLVTFAFDRPVTRWLRNRMDRPRLHINKNEANEVR